MNTQHLQYIIEIERTRSISQAAENLFIGQPNLSRILHDVEQMLGFRIFERSTRGVRPTTRGTIFLQHAKSILRSEACAVTPATCGVKMTFESRRRGFPTSKGSCSITSSPAPASCPLSSASYNAVSSTTLPRAQLIRYEPFGIRANSFAENMWYVVDSDGI